MPERKSSVILIKSDGSDADIFKLAGRQLVADGYTIKNSDSNFYSITTNDELRPNYSFKTSLKISILTGTVVIRANSSNMGFSFLPFYGNGKGRSVETITFGFMDSYAKALSAEIPNSKIVYAME